MVQLFGRSWTRHELERYAGNIDQLGGVRLGLLDDGKARGMRTAHFETGSGLAFTVLMDRGMDIGSARFQGASLAWESAVGPVHPMYYEKDGMGWHRTWSGGMVNGGGTTQIGMPCDDQGESLGHHGRLSHIPASHVWADAAWNGDEYEMWVQGKMRETLPWPSVRTENIAVTRRIWTHLGSSRLFMRDVVTNVGLEPAPHMMLYHWNWGFPLVAEGTALIAPSRGVRARVGEGCEPIDSTCYPAPIDGFQQQGFAHDIVAGEDGFATLVLANRGFDGGRGLGIYWRYRPSELPNLMQWVWVRAGNYVTAFEPFNATMMGRVRAREEGVLPILEPGQAKEYTFEVGVLANNAEIDARAAQIRTP